MANHMTQWKPEATVNGKRRQFNTYRELKSNIVELLSESRNNEVFVSRSKRGEWGEWFEYWQMRDVEIKGKFVRKPKIFKEGWM